MEKSYVKYFHYQSKWYYYFSNSNSSKDSVNWMCDNSSEIWLLSEDFLTKHQAFLLLKEKFPNKELIHVIEYRSGPRSKNNNGTRHHKDWTKRDWVKYSKITVY